MVLVIRGLVISIALVTACKGERSTSATSAEGSAGSGSAGSGSAAPVIAIDLCEQGKAALAAVTTCNGKPIEQELLTAKQTFIGVVDMIKQTARGGDRETTCAQMLHALDGSLASIGCSIPLSPAARTKMLVLVEAWYALRTEVTPTGNAAADDVIGRIVKVRDAVCACKTTMCLDQTQKQFDTLGAFAADAPDVAKALGDKLMDDVGRCGARITKPVKR